MTTTVSSLPFPHQTFSKLPRLAQEYIRFLEDRIRDLEGKMAKNSGNSSKPPSSDGLDKKPKIPGSQREKTGRKPGGQKGHPGTTLVPHLSPDRVVSLSVFSCHDCGHDLSSVPSTSTDIRQCLDLPKIQIEVTEYSGESKVCPCCRSVTSSEFPEGVDSRVGYGPNFKGLSL